MASRLGIAVAICVFLGSTAAGQVVRFETSLGDFDMVLNPTNNARLQGHVDNLLQYIERNAYASSWINRADEGFVLQMGGFYSHTKRPPRSIVSTRSVDALAPVTGSPGIPGLSNTAGTVSLALPGGAGGTNRNGGTTSFFVNIGNNSGLDTDFTVFAAVPNMTVVNQIMALMQIDRTTDPAFGAGGPGNLAFTDVPLLDNGQQVFIKRAFVVTDAMTIAQATAGVQSVMAQSALAGGGSSSARISSAAVPEPASGFMLLVGWSAMLLFGRRGSSRR